MNLEEVVEKAEEFLEKRRYNFFKLEKIVREDKIWNLLFDVGVFDVKNLEIKIDDNTGRVVSFEKLQ